MTYDRTVGANGTINSYFIISRDGGDGEQKVYYRTVNGSAVGSMNDNQYHFRHTDGVLTFADGETEKEVTVTEYGTNAEYSGAATKYTKLDSFTDASKASNYAVPALQWAV